ncbi:MAG: oligosaccharide flippase family protein [Syntrophobacteraceae bacterium]|nr:oligosaccharide flippase family protein [Desulfobacteraceae bacterium]
MNSEFHSITGPSAADGRSSCSQTEAIDGKIIQGSLWLFGLKLTTRSIGFLSTLVLARLLAPSEFGTLGIAVLAMGILEMFSQTGFDSALIQKKGGISEYLDATWTISAARGFLLCVILYFSAHGVGAFFNTPRAEEILRVLALAPLLSGLENVGMVFFSKQMAFRKVFIYEMCGNAVNAAVAVSCALVTRSVWALVFGLLANRVATVLLSYALHPYRPRFDFHMGKARELFGFGKWILGTQIVLFLVNRGDNFFVGKFLGPAALGLYGMAFNIAYLPFSEITQVLCKVMFPAYALVQDREDVLRNTYQKTVQLLAFLSLPFAGSVLLFSFDFTRLFLGEKWIPMVGSLQILSFSAACLSIGGITGNLLNGIGKPNIVMHFVSLRLLILGASIYPCTSRWGIEGTALAVLASGTSIGLFQILWGARECKCALRVILSDLAIPLAGVAASSLLVLLLRELWNTTGFGNFFLQAAVFLAAYFSLCYLAERINGYQAFTRIRTIFLKMAAARSGVMA